MKGNEVEAGMLVKTAHSVSREMQLVLGVGKFAIVQRSTSERKIVKWKGLRLAPIHWYVNSASINVRKVITLEIKEDGTAGEMYSLNFAQVVKVLGDDDVLQWLINVREWNGRAKANLDEEEVKNLQMQQLARVLQDLADGEEPIRTLDSQTWVASPFGSLLQHKDLMVKMISLWIRFCEQTKTKINGRPATEVYDDFIESVSEISTADQRKERAIERTVEQAALTFEDDEWWEDLDVENAPPPPSPGPLSTSPF